MSSLYPVPCILCGIKFYQDQDLISHVKVIHLERRVELSYIYHQCLICGEKFEIQKMTDLMKHMIRTTFFGRHSEEDDIYIDDGDNKEDDSMDQISSDLENEKVGKTNASSHSRIIKKKCLKPASRIEPKLYEQVVREGIPNIKADEIYKNLLKCTYCQADHSTPRETLACLRSIGFDICYLCSAITKGDSKSVTEHNKIAGHFAKSKKVCCPFPNCESGIKFLNFRAGIKKHLTRFHFENTKNKRCGKAIKKKQDKKMCSKALKRLNNPPPQRQAAAKALKNIERQQLPINPDYYYQKSEHTSSSSSSVEIILSTERDEIAEILKSKAKDNASREIVNREPDMSRVNIVRALSPIQVNRNNSPEKEDLPPSPKPSQFVRSNEMGFYRRANEYFNMESSIITPAVNNENVQNLSEFYPNPIDAQNSESIQSLNNDSFVQSCMFGIDNFQILEEMYMNAIRLRAQREYLERIPPITQDWNWTPNHTTCETSTTLYEFPIIDNPRQSQDSATGLEKELHLYLPVPVPPPDMNFIHTQQKTIRETSEDSPSTLDPGKSQDSANVKELHLYVPAPIKNTEPSQHKKNLNNLEYQLLPPLLDKSSFLSAIVESAERSKSREINGKKINKLNKNKRKKCRKRRNDTFIRKTYPKIPAGQQPYDPFESTSESDSSLSIPCITSYSNQLIKKSSTFTCFLHKCLFCEESFAIESDLDTHILNKLCKKFEKKQCHICNIRFSKFSIVRFIYHYLNCCWRAEFSAIQKNRLTNNSNENLS